MTAGARARRAAAGMANTARVTVPSVLDHQVGLDLECLDRIYLNGYVPNLQVGGQVVTFLTRHLGYPIPSPALFDKIGSRFRSEVARFVASTGVPLVRFANGDRKAEVMRPYLEAAAGTGRCGRGRGGPGVLAGIHRL